jgi:aromatic-L-amino-acid decarboxylase
MDYGIQLGRRFRSLKLWLTLRTFGAEGVRARIRAAVDLAQRFREVLSTEPGISVEAPSPFSVVVFRWSSPGLSPGEADAANRRILDRINSDGRTFISHTVLRGRHCLRVAIGNDQTTWSSLEAFLDALRDAIRLEGTATPILGPDSP